MITIIYINNNALVIIMKKTREQFEQLIDDYKTGKKGIQPGHPNEIQQAIKTFLDFSIILTEYPEMDHIPPEIVENLLNTLMKYPEYNRLTLDLINILKQHE
tara:strand:+ start:449 stop:754 length:306 start_codon:yes stop_codon:yes gene_type:complete